MSRDQQLFELMNEIGIISQLSSNALNRQLPGGLLVSHFSVLNHLVRLGDGCTPVEIARAFQVTKATMTNTLGKLEGAGLVELRAHPTDGRSKQVYLTPRGTEFRTQAIASLAPAMKRMAGSVDVDVLLATLPALRELRAYLDRNR